MELKLKFYGIDEFNRPVFKNVEKNNFYGSDEILFSHSATSEEVIKAITEKKIRVVYFGTHFNCEPEGHTLKSFVKVIFIK